MEIRPIAHIHNDFPENFGLPRQSGMAEHLISEIVMEEGFRQPDAFRDIEKFSHLWLIWEFDPLGASSTGEQEGRWSATVRPPKLGGNERVGVFATRSPNRPNRLGMTVVKLMSCEMTPDRGPVLKVAGADMKDGTAIYDIKPYVPFADCVSEATEGFTYAHKDERLEVVFNIPVPEKLSGQKFFALKEILALDPRPGYQDDPERVYAFTYGGYTVKFKVSEYTLIVTDIEEIMK